MYPKCLKILESLKRKEKQREFFASLNDKFNRFC